MGVQKQCGQLGHTAQWNFFRDCVTRLMAMVELMVDVSKPCLQRIGVVVGEADHADKSVLALAGHGEKRRRDFAVDRDAIQDAWRAGGSDGSGRWFERC